MHNLTVILPAATPGSRLKSYGPRPLLVVDDETILTKQIKIIGKLFPLAKIVLVTGFKPTRVQRAIPANSGIVTVHNPDYQTTGVTLSVCLAIEAVPSRKALVIYGDLVLKKNALQELADYGKSSVVYDNSHTKKHEVGVNVVDGQATQFEYGLKSRWPGIVMLDGKEKFLFHHFASEPHRATFKGHEILNLILEQDDTQFKAFESPSRILDFDCPKDLRVNAQFV